MVEKSGVEKFIVEKSGDEIILALLNQTVHLVTVRSNVSLLTEQLWTSTVSYFLTTPNPL